jgi:PII-like signaling protein
MKTVSCTTDSCMKWLLEHAKKMGIHGGSSFRAIAGYGRHGILHEQHFFELAGDLTVVTEFIVSEAEADAAGTQQRNTCGHEITSEAARIRSDETRLSQTKCGETLAPPHDEVYDPSVNVALA